MKRADAVSYERNGSLQGVNEGGGDTGMTERATGQHHDHITVMANYFSISNEIIQPDQYVSTSRYFCLKWEPSLGLVGARIVRVLRALECISKGHFRHFRQKQIGASLPF